MQNAVVQRRDIVGIELNQKDLASFNKQIAPVRRSAQVDAKPLTCAICGKPTSRFCNSHTIPQHCLKEIGKNGMLLTTAALTGTNLRKRLVGIASASIFKLICKKCDTEYFKLYETPETLLNKPSNQIMAQIAVKCLLNRISNAEYHIGLSQGMKPFSPIELHFRAAAKRYDLVEFERELKSSLPQGRRQRGKGFRCIYHRVLPYVAPLAFQQMVTLVADFEGNQINNLQCENQSYRTEPIYVCVLPSNGNTVVMLFRHETGKRYRQFEKQLRDLSEKDILLAIVKIIFAYSEDVFLNPSLGDELIRNKSLVKLARMEAVYEGMADETPSFQDAAHERMVRDFTLGNLPNPPALLSEEFELTRLR